MTASTPAEGPADKIAEKPTAPTTKAPAGNAKSPEVPPGYKIVKVRKPDGTIVRVKRPIDPTAVDKPATANATAATRAPSGTAAPRETEKAPVIAASTPAANSSPPKELTPATTAPGATAPIQTSNTPTTTAEKAPPAASPEKSNAAATTATATSTTKDVATSQPPAYTPSPVTSALLQVAPKFGLLARVTRHTARVANAFVPDLNIGEWQEGDDALDDDPDSDDEDYDDDGDDRRDDDDDRRDDTDDTLDGHSDTRDGAMHNEKHSSTGAGNATASHLLKGIAQIPQQQNAANQQARSGPTVTMDKKGPTVENKEIKNENPAQAGLKPPRQLSKRADWTRYVIWAIMIALPLLFIILGILVAVENGRPTTSALGQGVTQALKVGVSAWPIIFAAVAAQSLRAFATYKVERGIRLMTLEQLLSSNSVASSFKQPFVLRRFNWVTIALFALWSLSPLAGQAMVRVSYTDTSYTTAPISIAYVNTVYKSVALGSMYRITSDNLDYMQAVNRLYSAAFFPAGVNQLIGMDVWNYPLIPVLEQLPSTPDNDGWYNVNATNETIFSSIYGIPLIYWDPKNQSEYSFVIQSAYLHFECTPLQAKTMAAINATGVNLKSSATQTLWMDMANTVTQSQPGNLTFASLIRRNTTESSGNSTGSGSYSNTTESSGNNSTPTRKRQSTESQTPLYAYSTCTYTQTFVDTELYCEGNLCSADRIRRTPESPPVTLMGDMTQKFLTASGGGLDQGDLLTDTEQYLLNPASVDKEKTAFYDLSTLPLDVFTERLSLLINTFWQLGFAPPYQTGGLVYNTPDAAGQTNPYLIIENLANGTRTDHFETYATSWGWLAALFISSVILLIAGAASVIWDAQTIVPDILGFASSVARKSKYVDLPKMDSAMSGPERSRLLGDVKVMMQDVKPGAEVGRVALGTAHERAERLKPGRMYR